MLEQLADWVTSLADRGRDVEATIACLAGEIPDCGCCPVEELAAAVRRYLACCEAFEECNRSFT